MKFSRLVCEVAFLLCLLHQSCVLGVSALPLNDWASGVEKAASHSHWEHVVRRSAYRARYYSDHIVDDTAHIVNVQEYYRDVFDAGWDNYRDNERELFNMLNALENVVAQSYGETSHDDTVMSESMKHAMEFGIHTKRIPGRYIVMFQSDADDYVLDRTMAVMKKANLDSHGRVRATDMHALRYAGKGFTATLNSNAVQLVSPWWPLGRGCGIKLHPLFRLIQVSQTQPNQLNYLKVFLLNN